MVLNRLPNHPQPVPPIYQPEVAARAILHAAEHPRRREYWVGGSTIGTLLGDRFAPGLLDRYLARTGYKAQQSEQPADPNAPINLWSPADGPGGRDFGAHGAFDAKSGRPQCAGLAFATSWPAGGLWWGPRGPGRAAAVAPIVRRTVLQDDKEST